MHARLLALAAVFVLQSVPGFAQTDFHIYGGGIVGGEEHVRGALGGTGLTNGVVYAGVDGHGLWFTDEGMNLIAREVPRGLDFTTTMYGADVVVGGVVRSGNVDLIPVGIIGYTTAELEICFDSFCDDESETEANVGGGVIVAFKGESGRGLHAGFRWTRNYGAAVSVGFVFQVGASSP